MLFNSQIFIFAFLPATLFLYHFFLKGLIARKTLLLAASILFYSYWDIAFLPLLLLSIGLNWSIVIYFTKYISLRFAILIGISINLMLLAIFKYADFIMDNLGFFTGVSYDNINIILPLGISFFTFQQISYLVDYMKGQAKEYNLLDYALYVSFFPQLIAGPIVRHQQVIPQFQTIHKGSQVAESFSRGVVLFIIGLSKKVLLADPLSTLVNPTYQLAAQGVMPSVGDAWIAVGAFSGQIYFDFSGYSDMAIGLALMFGLTLPINFNAPYRAVSIQDFWRRWHITLSSFLRDYLYIPLGGNRGKLLAPALTLLITMLLGGLWHGAAWNFVLWGGLHGSALAVHRLWSKTNLSLNRYLAIFITFLFVSFVWITFRVENLQSIPVMLSALVDFSNLEISEFKNLWVLPVGLILAIFGPTSHTIAQEKLGPNNWLAVIFAGLCIFCLLKLGGDYNYEFIYFQF